MPPFFFCGGKANAPGINKQNNYRAKTKNRLTDTQC